MPVSMLPGMTGPDALDSQLNPFSRSARAHVPSLAQTLSTAWDQGIHDTPALAIYRSHLLNDSSDGGPTGFNKPTGRRRARNTTPIASLTGEEGTSISRADVEKLYESMGLPKDVLKKQMGTSEYFNYASAVIIAENKLEELRRQQILAEGSTGIFRMSAVMGAQILAGIADPINTATSFVPVGRMAMAARAMDQTRKTIGVTRRARQIKASVAAQSAARSLELSRSGAFKRAGMRFKEGVIEGTAGTLLTEPFIASTAGEYGEDYTAEDFATAMLFGAILGGGIQAGMGVVGDTLSKLGKDATIGEMVKAMDTASVEPDGLMSERVMNMKPGEREVVQRHVTAAVMDGRKPDAETLMTFIETQGSLGMLVRKSQGIDGVVRAGDDIFDNVGELFDTVRASSLTARDLDALGLSDKKFKRKYLKASTPEDRTDAILSLFARKQKQLESASIKRHDDFVAWVNDSGGLSASARQTIGDSTDALSDGGRTFNQLRKDAKAAGFGSLGKKEMERILHYKRKGVKTFNESSTEELSKLSGLLQKTYEDIQRLSEQSAIRGPRDVEEWAKAQHAPEASISHDPGAEAHKQEVLGSKDSIDNIEESTEAVMNLVDDLNPELAAVARAEIGAIRMESKGQNDAISLAVSCLTKRGV